MFKLAVCQVILETSYFCNRRCGYCPNATIDRISDKKYLSLELLEKISSDLGSIDYSEEIQLQLYNEPLADPDICKKISIIRSHCPNARITIYSNGDYLNQSLLEELRAAGLSALQLAFHLGNTDEWSDERIIERLTEMSVRLGKVAKLEQFIPGMGIRGKFPDKSMDITIAHQDYYKSGSDRAGLVSSVQPRQPSTAPCIVPFVAFHVAWDGSLMPCCHVHPDAPEHQGYKIGNVADFPDIFLAYANSSLADWRRSLAVPGVRKPPCDTCPEGVGDGPSLDLLMSLYGDLVGTAG